MNKCPVRISTVGYRLIPLVSYWHYFLSNWNHIQKIWCTYIVEYYLAIKNKDIMNFADKWVKFENIIMSEVTQSQSDMHEMYSPISVISHKIQDTPYCTPQKQRS